MKPEEVAIKQYGPNLGAAIHALRSSGLDVGRYKDAFQINGAKVEAGEIYKRAAELKARKTAATTAHKPASPRAPMARHEINQVPGAGDLGAEEAGTAGINDRPGSPSAEYAARAKANLSKSPCISCGGPRSKWSKGLCANCYMPPGRQPDPKPPTTDVRDKFWRAVGPANEQPKSCGGRGVQTTADNPAPHASRSQQGQATPDIAPPLPIEAGQGCAAIGNVAKPETDPGRPPRSSPPQDLMPDLCRCGRPRTHHGRCWAKRGQAGPPDKRVYPRGRNHTSRITALEADLATTKAEFAAFKETVKAAMADLVEHMGLGEHR